MPDTHVHNTCTHQKFQTSHYSLRLPQSRLSSPTSGVVARPVCIYSERTTVSRQSGTVDNVGPLDVPLETLSLASEIGSPEAMDVGPVCLRHKRELSGQNCTPSVVSLWSRLRGQKVRMKSRVLMEKISLRGSLPLYYLHGLAFRDVILNILHPFHVRFTCNFRFLDKSDLSPLQKP